MEPSSLNQNDVDYGQIYESKIRHYHKSSIKPPGAYLILDTPEGGFLERGLIQKVR